MIQPVFETTATALREKSKLRRHFRRFDVFFYLICTVVTIDTIGAVASNGAQGFTWLIFLGVFFFLPYALSVAELGSAFPQEGGWPGFGATWFGGGGNPNDNLAALSFSHQRLQYELTQIVPLAVIVGVGVVFYLLGGKTRRETAAEPVAPAYVPADDHEPAP